MIGRKCQTQQNLEVHFSLHELQLEAPILLLIVIVVQVLNHVLD